MDRLWEKPFPRRYCVGGYPFQRDGSRNALSAPHHLLPVEFRVADCSVTFTVPHHIVILRCSRFWSHCGYGSVMAEAV